MESRNSFVFYRSYFDAIEMLPASQQLILYRAISKHGLDGEEIKLPKAIQALFALIKPQMEANRKRYEGGKRGGAPRGNQNAQKDNQAAGEVDLENNLKQPMVDLENNLKQPMVDSENNLKQPIAEMVDSENNLKQPNVNVNVNANVNANENEEDPPSTPPEGEGDAAEKFNAFWEAYPKKTGEGDAVEAWKDLYRTNGIDDVLQGVILKAVEEQRRSEQWMREDGRYILSPAKWIRGRHWNDVLARGSPPPGGKHPPDGTPGPNGSTWEGGELWFGMTPTQSAKWRAEHGST